MEFQDFGVDASIHWDSYELFPHRMLKLPVRVGSAAIRMASWVVASSFLYSSTIL